VVLSALLFMRKTFEVVWTNLDLGNLKTKILGENVKKAESTQYCSPVARPQLAFGKQLLRELAVASKSLAVASQCLPEPLFCFAICFAWDFERRSLGSVRDVL